MTLATDIRDATVEGRVMLVEATITATATGRPRLAEPEQEGSGLTPTFRSRNIEPLHQALLHGTVRKRGIPIRVGK